MIKALIVEDEILAADRLQVLIHEIASEIKIENKTHSVYDTIAYLKEYSVDLIFLDINLSDGLSFEIFDQIKNRTPIIFTTAYSEHAIKAFEQNSISYLLKPIKREELALAISKFKTYYDSNNRTRFAVNFDYQELFQNFTTYKKRFLVKMNNSLEAIDVNEINYFYSQDKVTFLVTESGNRLPIELTLKQIESELDPSVFFRINRKYIIALESIKKMYYVSKSRIKVELTPENSYESDDVFVAIEKIGKFKKWLSI